VEPRTNERGEPTRYFGDEPIEVQDFRKITRWFNRIYGIYFEFMETDTTYNQPVALGNTGIVCPQNSPGHCHDVT
jgi:hypothetical protein